jgi:hypothetical protein
MLEHQWKSVRCDDTDEWQEVEPNRNVEATVGFVDHPENHISKRSVHE